MVCIKNIYENNKIVNTLKFNNKYANIELINLLFNKIDNKYKISIKKDTYCKRIEATLYFTQENNKNKYKYEYVFKNVNDINFY